MVGWSNIEYGYWNWFLLELPASYLGTIVALLYAVLGIPRALLVVWKFCQALLKVAFA